MAYIFRISIMIAALFVTVTAWAQFETVNIPKGLDFECDADETVDECEDRLEYEVWSDKYGDLRDKWRDELLFNTNIYFHPIEGWWKDGPVSANTMDFIHEESNLIDASYQMALRRYNGGWAFAIEMLCSGRSRLEPEKCKPILRLVSFDKNVATTPKFKYPVSKEEVLMNFKPYTLWRETDLRTCPLAIKHFSKFPANNKFWDKKFMNWVKGKPYKTPEEIIVTTDGDSVFLRARGEGDPSSPNLGGQQKYIIFDDRNRGDGYRWAKEMRELVEPCLKSSKATSPWQKVFDYEASKK